MSSVFKKTVITISVLGFATLVSTSLQADGFENAAITSVQSQYNDTNWAARNLIDGNDRTRWLSVDQTNDINILLSQSGDPRCFEGLSLKNYTVSGRNIKEFALLTTSDDALASDFGTVGWQPIVADESPNYLINYLSWAQGARIVDIDSELTNARWHGEHVNDGDTRSRWLSNKARNVIEYNFDTDWNGSTGDGITINELEVLNYGTNDRAVKEFQIEYTLDGTSWLRLEVPGTAAGDPEYIFSRDVEGGRIDAFDSAYNATRWTGEHINDGDLSTYWLSSKRNNFVEFSFDPNRNGITGANGDVADLFSLQQLRLFNYGLNNNRSIRQFQVEVKTLSQNDWQKISVPGAQVGSPNYNFAMSFHGGQLSEISYQHNTTNWAAKNIHDGDPNTRWLSRQQNSQLAFAFDANENGTLEEAADLFTFEAFNLINYGNDDRAIKNFQIQVRTNLDASWQAVRVPGASVGDANFNFALVNNGALLTSIDDEHNNSNWAAANIYDGDSTSRWLSSKSNNELQFEFDVNQNGIAGEVADAFRLETIVLENYGNHGRAINEFQVEVLTSQKNADWQLLPAPGKAINDPNFNFALSNNGGQLEYIEYQHNTTTWAAANIHDGDLNSRWLTRYANTKLEFAYDVNRDGRIEKNKDDFTVQRLYLKNYGNNDRSVKEFQIAYKPHKNADWEYVVVPGSGAGIPDYNYALPAHGGSVSRVDAQLNTSSWAADNIHDGNYSSRWLSNKQVNEIDFTFDTDKDGVSGDVINLSQIELINYGNDDRSVATFEIYYQQNNGPWQLATIQGSGGLTTFNAALGNATQNWSLDAISNVTAVRFKSLSNHGDPSYTGVRELRIKGDTVGPIYSFTAQMSAAGEYFELDPSNLPTDVIGFRFETVSNYGDPSYTGVAELKLLGNATVRPTIFTAEAKAEAQTFALEPDDIPDDVIAVRLKTISNHGDGRYTGAREFRLLGPAITETTIFTAQQSNALQTFTLDSDDVVNNVTGVRLVTINNHGDPAYIGAREFEVLGPSVTETKTFEALAIADGQTFTLDAEDIPVNVTDVRVTTINNHGNTRFIGARELELIGPSVTPADTFYLPQTKGPHRFVLDEEDTITGAVGLRLVTINNHGDRTYTGLTELKVFGDPITPSYIFNGANTTSLQTFNFESVNAKYLRLHTMTSYGDTSYIAAAELSLIEGNCAAGQWSLNELVWDGSEGEVLDSSGSDFHGKALGTASGDIAQTAYQDPAIAGSPGTCRYGDFDGVDDYLEIQDRDSLDNTSQITLSAWFNARTMTQTNGTNARGILSKRPDYRSNMSYGMFFLNGGGNRLYVDIDSQNNRFRTSQVFNENQWYHVAVVFDGSLPQSQRVSVYVDGVLEGRYPESSTFIPNTNSNFYIGNLYTGTNELKVFDGFIDEVNVIPFAYSQAQVNNLMRQTKPCAVALDHIEISHSGSGVSCSSQTVDIRACANSDCSALFTGQDISFTLQKEQTGVVSELASYTIDGNTGVLSNASFEHRDVGSFNLTGTSSIATDIQCQNRANGSNDCGFNITSSGFIVSQGDGSIAQSCSANSFTIQAVRSPATGDNNACVPAYANQSVAVNFGFDYQQPSGTDVANPAELTIQGQNYTAGIAQGAVNLLLDNEAKAQINVEYQEAGLVNVVVTDSSNNLSGAVATQGFVPAQLTAQWADNDPNNVAGVTEQIVISGQCADGTTLQNYQASGDFSVTAQRTMPSDAEILSVAPAVTPNDMENLIVGNSTSVAPNSGAVQVDLTGASEPKVIDINYDEAARLAFAVTDNNYLGQAISTVTDLSGYFAMSYYTAAVNTPSLASFCGDFNYIGQQIEWAESPEVTLTAKNALNETVEFIDVLNYWPQNISSISTEMLANSYQTQVSNANNQISIINDAFAVLEDDKVAVDGSRSYLISEQLLQFRKSYTADVPFVADVDLTIPATTFIDSFGAGIKTINTDTQFLPVEIENITGTTLLYGRVKAESTYGSELQSLTWKAELQTLNANGLWQLNSNDSCTVFSQNAIQIDGLNQYDVEANPPRYTLDLSGASTYLIGFSGQSSVTASAGLVNLPFAAPGSLNIGSFNIDVDLSLENPHLRWTWSDDASGTFTDADADGIDDSLDLNVPQTKVTFGRYRGNDRIIYKRER